MAGHRKKWGRPKRSDVRQQRQHARLAAATTAEEQLAASYDRFRAAARQEPDAGKRSRMLHEASVCLARLCDALDEAARTRQ